MGSVQERKTKPPSGSPSSAISEKKKKKKPTKIVVGMGIDDGGTATRPVSTKPANSRRKPPTPRISSYNRTKHDANNKQNGGNETVSRNSEGNNKNNKNTKQNPHPNKSNGNNSKYNPNSKINSEGNKGAKTTKTNESNSQHHKGNNNFITRLQAYVDAGAVREALGASNELPGKLQNALGSATLELNDRREFVVHKKDNGNGNRVNYSALRRILQKNALQGWLEWLQGRRGWTINTDKFPYLNYHRDLHEAYSTVMRALLKKADPDLKRRLVVLYYKQDPETQENGGCPIYGTRQNTQTLWKKVSEKESLQDAVGKIRPFLEVIRYFCTDPKEKWTTLPWLAPIVTREECRKRLTRISELVQTLMRSSDWGPDVPVHWAAHPALNHYPRSTTTPATMTELVVGTANILSNLFLRYPITVDNLEGVDKILPKFSSWTEDDSGGRGKLKTARSMKTNTADEVDPLVIDLTGLSISDHKK
eukprot:jgi/Psemu1/24346/gm1.24346_g